MRVAFLNFEEDIYLKHVKIILRAEEMAYCIGVLAVKTENLSLILRTYIMEGEELHS